MAGIFISYRRDESRHAAGRLADDLAQAFGAESIFRDIEGIEPGLDFTHALEKALAASRVMLVLIGPQWLAMTDTQGRRRLDRPDDWIRQEIATALRRDIRVIPVLLEGAKLPEADALPEDLQALVRRQALDLSDVRWRGDLQRLVETLARVPGLRPRPPEPPAPPPPPPPAPAPPAPVAGGAKKPLFMGVAIGAVGLLVLAGIFGGEQAAGPVNPGPPPGSQGGDDPQGPSPAPSSLAPQPGQPVQQAVSPAPQAAVPARPPASPSTPDVAGAWVDPSDVRYEVRQVGTRVELVAFGSGVQVGTGVGEFDGPVLTLNIRAQFLGTPVMEGRCQLQPDPGGQTLQGQCMWPMGPEAQLWRRVGR